MCISWLYSTSSYTIYVRFLLCFLRRHFMPTRLPFSSSWQFPQMLFGALITTSRASGMLVQHSPSLFATQHIRYALSSYEHSSLVL